MNCQWLPSRYTTSIVIALSKKKFVDIPGTPGPAQPNSKKKIVKIVTYAIFHFPMIVQRLLGDFTLMLAWRLSGHCAEGVMLGCWGCWGFPPITCVNSQTLSHAVLSTGSCATYPNAFSAKTDAPALLELTKTCFIPRRSTRMSFGTMLLLLCYLTATARKRPPLDIS